MLLIYSPHITSRIEYTLDVIFGVVIKTNWKLTSDLKNFKEYKGAKINYSNSDLKEGFHLGSFSLLSSTGIELQPLDVFKLNDFKAFFKVDKSDYPFDVFSATFYLISRYEEYLPHSKDFYGRFPYTTSLASRENFLDVPLVNIWLQHFKNELIKKYKDLNFKEEQFQFFPTYDIDIAWSFKNKGPLRNLGGFIKKPSIERLKVLSGIASDPFDSYSFLKDLHERKNLNPKYFILTARRNNIYDKNILPSNNDFKLLIKNLDGEICLHPSWGSNDDLEEIKAEKKLLEEICDRAVEKSRQHYIKLLLPKTYSDLIKAGIKEEYSMGFGSTNGFRASIASSYYWYNISKEEKTDLLLHPFCFMDANSFYEQKQDVETTLTELRHYLKVCRSVNANLITIFHNHFLGSDPMFKGWREMYENFIEECFI